MDDISPYPVWRVSWRDDGNEFDSYESFTSPQDAQQMASQRICWGHQNVRVSWPHYLDEPPQGDGWINVADLPPDHPIRNGRL